MKRLSVDEALQTLDVQRDAAWDDLRSAYRDRVRSAHPDVNEGNDNDNLVVSKSNSNEDILMSVLNGSGLNSHKDVVALNASLVLWVAGIEDDLNEGFKKALFVMNQAYPWKNFLLLKNYLSSDDLITN